MRITAWLFGVLLSILGSVAGAETLSYTTYYHNDHLGSPVAATNEQGALLWRAHFRPYGERQEDPKEIAFGSVGYTGHIQDADSGMVYAGARYYDPLIGRFMAIDPAPVSASVPESFNRYLYANNNPYAYTDPDGELPFLVIAAVAFGGMMAHSDMANAPAEGETPQQLGTMDHLGALPGLNAGKVVTTLKAAGEVKDAARVAKEVTLSRRVHGEAAEHAADAIRAGKPDVLTIARSGASANRAASTGGLAKVPGKQLDEYPPAMFKEGGAGASVRPISPRDNMSAGACIGNACRGLPDGARVRIRVED